MDDFTARQNFARNLRRLLRANDMTMRTLGEKVGTSGCNVSRWARGESLPVGPKLAVFLATFNITMAEMTGSEPVLPDSIAAFDLPASLPAPVAVKKQARGLEFEIELFKQFLKFRETYKAAV